MRLTLLSKGAIIGLAAAAPLIFRNKDVTGIGRATNELPPAYQIPAQVEILNKRDCTQKVEFKQERKKVEKCADIFYDLGLNMKHNGNPPNNAHRTWFDVEAPMDVEPSSHKFIEIRDCLKCADSSVLREWTNKFLPQDYIDRVHAMNDEELLKAAAELTPSDIQNWVWNSRDVWTRDLAVDCNGIDAHCRIKHINGTTFPSHRQHKNPTHEEHTPHQLKKPELKPHFTNQTKHEPAVHYLLKPGSKPHYLNHTTHADHESKIKHLNRLHSRSNVTAFGNMTATSNMTEVSSKTECAPYVRQFLHNLVHLAMSLATRNATEEDAQLIAVKFEEIVHKYATARDGLASSNGTSNEHLDVAGITDVSNNMEGAETNEDDEDDDEEEAEDEGKDDVSSSVMWNRRIIENATKLLGALKEGLDQIDSTEVAEDGKTDLPTSLWGKELMKMLLSKKAQYQTNDTEVAAPITDQTSKKLPGALPSEVIANLTRNHA
ncbi:uncharacterized protein LY89DRAFT_744217 [Mollisia scopiformis]|uniref:Uncharacterized protein n=1 Tax=Mollisia scopiformis TaxID=149040 RepID=A0A194XVM2_MOLSC|nr:uncharacterized protein LY89DRAFT_744217 [Mollisia scopiformis]KUJ23757.1 hypothetical protein LY89DRAFT_744217 [Mollisia scopiformis]